MHAQLMLPTHIAGDDGKLATGRQGREGRDFLSPLKQPFYRNFHIHERRTRAYARGGKNNGDVFSRPSRPTWPGGAVGGPRCGLGVGAIYTASGAARTNLRPKPAVEVIGGLQEPTGKFGGASEVPLDVVLQQVVPCRLWLAAQIAGAKS